MPLKIQKNKCIYCGLSGGTRDHVPPRIFLDKPYPQNYTTVPACQKCNQEFGNDDEYIAYWIEFMRAIECNNGVLDRTRIEAIFAHSTRLDDRIFNSLKVDSDNIPYMDFENSRIINFFKRVAVAHFFVNKGEKTNLNNWDILFFLAKQSQPNTKRYEILGHRPDFNKPVFHDNISWEVIQPNNYKYFVDKNKKCVFVCIRDFLFGKACFCHNDNGCLSVK